MDDAEATPPVAGESVTTTRGASGLNWSNLQKDYERLGSFKAVALEYGVAPETVSRAAKQLGVTNHFRKSIDETEIAARYTAGASVEDLAEQFGCSAGTIYARLTAAGVEMRPSGPNGWKWAEEQHAKRRAAVERGAYKGNHREHFQRLGSRTPKENSPSERLLHQALVKASLSFETQSRELGRYWPDVKLHQQPILIEVDGWAHNMAARKDADERRDQALQAAGYTVVRFMNEQIDADSDGCVRSLMERFGLHAEDRPVALIRDRRSYE